MESKCPSGDVIASLSNSFRQLLCQKNFDRISITEIVKLAYVNRNSFYYHFRSKTDLAIVVLANELSQAKRHYDSGGHLTVYDIAFLVSEERELFSNLLNSTAGEKINNYMYNELANYIIWLVEEKYSYFPILKEDADLLISWHSECAVSALKGWISCQYKAPFLEPHRDAAVKATIEIASKEGIIKAPGTKPCKRK